MVLDMTGCRLKITIIISIILFVIVLAVAIILVPQLSKKDAVTALEENGYKVEQIHIDLENVHRPHTYLFVADYHFLDLNEEINEADTENMKVRYKRMLRAGTTDKTDDWFNLVDTLNQCQARAVLFGGDMVDFASQKNVDTLKEGIDQLKLPYMYIRADHDLEPWWCTDNITKEQALEYQQWSSSEDGTYKIETRNYMIIGWDNNTSQMSEQTLAKMKEAFSAKKPIILMTHVPIDSIVDTSLEEVSIKVWKKNLTWGTGSSHYVPNEVTKEFLGMVYAPDSPVVNIISGHLHHTWDGQITTTTSGHVIAPAYSGTVGVITIE